MKATRTLVAAAVCGCCLFSRLALGGSWVEVPEPVVDTSGILGLTVVSDKDVWAAGLTNSGSYKTLTEHWDGRSWSVVPSPNEFSKFSILYDVAAVTTNDVWGVGEGAKSDLQTLAMHWNGSAWLTVPTPNVDFRDNYLRAASVVSTNDVWAAGSSDTTSGSHRYLPLALHWDGTAWTISTTPLSSGSAIVGLRALATNDVWAVGLDVSGQDFSTSTTYTMHWDGTAWSTIPSPNGSFAQNVLIGVAGATSNDVWAVGNSYDTSGNSQVLAMHWDGTAWTVMQTAPITGTAELQSVVALSAGNVWAAGAANGQSLIERWNGRAWKIASLPALQDPSSLVAIASGLKGALWTTGAQSTGQLFLKMTR